MSAFSSFLECMFDLFCHGVGRAVSVPSVRCAVSHSVMSNSFPIPWIVARQAPLSMGLPRQEYWSELLFPSPGGLHNPGIGPSSPALAGRFFTTEPPGNLDVTSQCCELSSFPFTCFLLGYSCSCTIFCSSRGAPQGQNPQLTYDRGLPCHPCTGPWLLISDS